MAQIGSPFREGGSTATVDPGPELAFKVRFPGLGSMERARGLFFNGLPVTVDNPKRLYISVLSDVASERSDVLERARRISAEYDAQLEDDPQYEVERPESWYESLLTPAITASSGGAPEGSMKDVLRAIDCDAAWKVNRGAGATIAVVDTGIADRPEFRYQRRVGEWYPTISSVPRPWWGRFSMFRPREPFKTGWTDPVGHGTMCAAIAAASRSDGGGIDGVAPEADLIACRTSFRDGELTQIYDYLINLLESGLDKRLIITNSFGFRSASPPPPDGGDFLLALQEAIDRGIVVVFSAGNNHHLTGAAPDSCSPNSIWAFKSWEGVATVGTSTMDGRLWGYSSRGPGQWIGQPRTASKPDVVAPTPANGRIPYGTGESVLTVGWGTSGAAPQVAGLAALLLTKSPHLGVDACLSAIRDGATSLGLGAECEGAGQISCSNSLGLV